MLGILAEVASATLKNKTVNPDEVWWKAQSPVKLDVHKQRQVAVQRLQHFSASQLVHHFTTHDFDELKRQFAYTCHFAEDCQRIFKSFGSEKLAEREIKKHLKSHVEALLEGQVTLPIPTRKRNLPEVPKCPRDHDYCNQLRVLNKHTDNVTRITLDEWITILRSMRENRRDQRNENTLLGDFMQEELTQSREVSLRKKHLAGKEPIPVVGSEIEVEYNPAEFLLMRSSELPIIQDNRSKGIVPPENRLSLVTVSSPRRNQSRSRDDSDVAVRREGFYPLVQQEELQKPLKRNVAKPYKCGDCSATFTRQHSLNYHLLIHLQQTRFTCPDCSRQFRHPSHYKEHRRRHTGEAPYLCSECNTRYRARNSYKRHLVTAHGKVLTTAGSLIILSDDEFAKVKKKPRLGKTLKATVI